MYLPTPFTMSSIRNLVVVGGRGDNPAVLKTRLDPMKLEDGMGIAATSIAFGEIYNINHSNNKFTVGVTRTSLVNKRLTKHTVWKLLNIPKGRYVLNEDVFWEIYLAINNYLSELDREDNNVPERCRYDEADVYNGKTHIDVPSNDIVSVNVIVGDELGPWSIINAHKEHPGISIPTGELTIPNEMAFLYVNIVENSYINGKKSRLLAVFPVESVKGYTHFESPNPNYVPIEVKELSEIDIELRDIKDRLLKINNSYDTVISMHIMPINRIN